MNLFKKNHKENRIGNSFFRKIGKDSHVDWAMIVLFGILLCSVLVAVGVVKYVNLESRLKQNTNTKTKLENVIDVKALDKVLSEYDERVNLRADYIRQYVGPKDPSI